MPSQKRPPTGLTIQEEDYCIARASGKGKNQLEAWRIAYPHQKSSNTTVYVDACRKEKKPAVAVRIAELSARIHQRMTERAVEQIAVTRDWVRQQFVENVLMAKRATPVLGSVGEPTGEYRVDLGAANRALELLGKDIGMFRNEDGNSSNPIDQLTDEQVRVLADAVDRELERRATEAAGEGGPSKPH